METFTFDPAGNLLDDKTQELNRPLESDPRRNKLMDNLLREYAGTHYQYDDRGNLIHRLHNGEQARLSWDLFDRLARFDDGKLSVVYSYDALGRRLHKHSTAHHQDDPRAGSGWNQMQRAKRQRELGCGYTLYDWDGDNLAWESSPPQDEGDTGRTVHYLYEPGSFVPVAQALRKSPIRLLRQPDWSDREYDFDQDPLWQHEIKPQAIDAIAWYQCDHLGTPMELTDHNGEVAWTAQYKAWGAVKEARSEWAKQVGLSNSIRFQGQYHDHETGLHYNRYRYYDPNIAKFISQDPIGLLGGTNLYQYAPNPLIWIDPLGLSKVTVGRWMGPSEYNQMTSTGKVVQSSTGTTHVASPASIDAFGKQAKPGTKYVEFNVPEESLIKTNEGWAKIVGPDSLEGRLAKRKGNPVPEMPVAEDIQVKAHKTEDGIIKCS